MNALCSIIKYYFTCIYNAIGDIMTEKWGNSRVDQIWNDHGNLTIIDTASDDTEYQRDTAKSIPPGILIRTGYRFSESYLVEDQHAKTVVFRRGDTLPAIVANFGFAQDSVVSRYVAAFGPRVHHTAFSCDDIRATVISQKHDGIPFTTDQVVGDEHKGLLQILTKPSAYSGEIFEYIQRFRGFRGFFLAANVGTLMQSTQDFNVRV